MTLGFIGFGNMAMAIASGVLRSRILVPEKIYAYDISKSKINEFLNDYSINVCNSVDELLSLCDTVVLAVKPQNYSDVLSASSKCDVSKITFISIAAGISIGKIRSFLGNDAKVVRLMPNTPLLLGYGATAACRSDNISDDKFNEICSLFECSGEVSVITEDKMNEIISVNGSSPAYLFLFAKAVCEYAQSCGIDYDTAKHLFAQTMIGSAKMVIDSGDDLQTLIDKVTSKGGTTAKALEKFYEADFCEIIKSAMDACTRRANELGQEY